MTLLVWNQHFFHEKDVFSFKCICLPDFTFTHFVLPTECEQRILHWLHLVNNVFFVVEGSKLHFAIFSINFDLLIIELSLILFGKLNIPRICLHIFIHELLLLIVWNELNQQVLAYSELCIKLLSPIPHRLSYNLRLCSLGQFLKLTVKVDSLEFFRCHLVLRSNFLVSIWLYTFII